MGVDSTNENSLYSALSKAQSEIKPPKKDKNVDFSANGRRIKYSYASLADIIECIRKPFANHGLSFCQSMQLENGSFLLVTSIFHSSGAERITSTMPLPDPTTMKPQDFASILTYFKRYSLASLAGVESEEDDDGQLAQENVAPAEKTKPAPKASEPTPKSKLPLTPIDELKHLTVIKGIKNQQVSAMIKERYGKGLSTELTDDEVKDLINHIRAL